MVTPDILGTPVRLKLTWHKHTVVVEFSHTSPYEIRIFGTIVRATIKMKRSALAKNIHI